MEGDVSEDTKQLGLIVAGVTLFLSSAVGSCATCDYRQSVVREAMVKKGYSGAEIRCAFGGGTDALCISLLGKP